MALQISPPSCFDFSKPESWESPGEGWILSPREGWITRFERYCSVAGLRNVEDATAKKLDTLLYLLGR